MGERDDFVRRYDLERVERAVDGQRQDLAAAERRATDVREADNARVAAELDALEARLLARFDRHQTEHRESEQKSEQKRDRVWGRGIALAAALAGALSAWVAFLVYLHGH